MANERRFIHQCLKTGLYIHSIVNRYPLLVDNICLAGLLSKKEDIQESSKLEFASFDASLINGTISFIGDGKTYYITEDFMERKTYKTFQTLTIESLLNSNSISINKISYLTLDECITKTNDIVKLLDANASILGNRYAARLNGDSFMFLVNLMKTVRIDYE